MWRSRSSSRHCRIEQSNAMNAAVAPYARRIGRVKSFRPIRGPGARARPPPLAVGDSESRGCRTRPSDRDRGIRSASTTCARSPRHRKWRRNCFAWRGAGASARIVAGFCWPWSEPGPGGSLTADVQIGSWKRPWNEQPPEQCRPLGARLRVRLLRRDPRERSCVARG